MAELASLSAIVHGRVQGVLFRDFVQGHAELLGLTGYVMNLPGEMVEVWAEGEKEKLLQLIKYLEAGPRRARVQRVDVNWLDYSGKFRSFDIRYF